MVCSVDVVPNVVCPRVVCSVDVGSGEGTKRVVGSKEGTKRVSVIIAVLDAVDAAAVVDVVVVVVCP